uniref:Uncharacterized protein n=1 Tax=viral metagenome TaxID=1070528 RepID=A0A6M3KP20_9ZZZZ
MVNSAHIQEAERLGMPEHEPPKMDCPRCGVRNGVVCAMISRLSSPGKIVLNLTKEQKEEINQVVEFIVTGK